MNTPQAYFDQLFFNPKTFFEEVIDYQKIKYFNVVFGIYCIGYGIDRLTKQFTKKDFAGELEQIEFMNNWPMFWGLACIGGLIGGYIAYLVGGWFYNVRIKWSKGIGNIDKSRIIYVYSSLFIYGFTIIHTLFQTVLFDIPHVSEADSSYFDSVSLLLAFGFLYHALYISYKASLTYSNILVDRARLWFLILPGLLYLFSFLFLFIGLSGMLE